MDAASHIRWAFLRAEYARFGGRLGGEGDPMLCSGVKRLPLLFTLPYWKVRLKIWKRCDDWSSYLCWFLNDIGHVIYAGPPHKACYGCDAH
jgi:hypothetical protein